VFFQGFYFQLYFQEETENRKKRQSLFAHFNHIKDILQDNLLRNFFLLPTFNYNYSPGLTEASKRFITISKES
jgi:hypothetical protein